MAGLRRRLDCADVQCRRQCQDAGLRHRVSQRCAGAEPLRAERRDALYRQAGIQEVRHGADQAASPRRSKPADQLQEHLGQRAKINLKRLKDEGLQPFQRHSRLTNTTDTRPSPSWCTTTCRCSSTAAAATSNAFNDWSVMGSPILRPERLRTSLAASAETRSVVNATNCDGPTNLSRSLRSTVKVTSPAACKARLCSSCFSTIAAFCLYSSSWLVEIFGSSIARCSSPTICSSR